MTFYHPTNDSQAVSRERKNQIIPSEMYGDWGVNMSCLFQEVKKEGEEKCHYVQKRVLCNAIFLANFNTCEK